MFGKRKIAALVAELVGTGVLTILVLSVQRSTIGVPFFVAAAAGLSVVLMSFAVAATSGGYFNPALTLGSWTARKLSTTNAILYIAVQFLGAYLAYLLYTYFVNNTLQPIGGKFSTRVLTAEVVGTAIFAFGWASALYQRLSLAVSASIAGLALMIGIIAASSASLGLLNPAVALGVKAWVLGTYVLGPIIGAVIGFNLYGLLFAENEEKGGSAAVGKPVASSAKTSSAKTTKTTKAKKAPAKKKTTRAKK